MGGSGGASGAFGYGQNSSNASPQSLTLNPATLILGQALGFPGRTTRNGGLTFSNMGSNLPFQQGSVDPRTFDALSNLFAPRGGNVITGTPLVGAFGQEALGSAANALNLFNTGIMPAANELVNTGFKTDIQPAIAQAQSRFKNDFLPAAADQFNLLGLNANDSDFGAAIAREAGRINTDLGSQDIALQEAANQRRMQGLPIAGTLAQGSAQFPIGLANDIFGFENAARGAEFAGSPEGQIFNLLASIGGIPTQGGIGTQSRQDAFNFNLATSGYGGGGIGGGKSGGGK